MTPKGTRPRPTGGPTWAPSARDEPDLLRVVASALRSGEPLPLLSQVSSLLTIVDPREYGFGREERESPISREELIGSFLDIDRPETSAILAVIAEMSSDEVEVARIRRELDRRRDRLPPWLDRLDRVEIVATREMVHVLGDGDNVNIGVRLVGGHQLTAVVYIDHNVGTIVKDAFVVPESLDELERFMRAKTDDPDTVWRDLPPADARARVIDAVDRAAMTLPPYETDSWPACRPIVEWLVRRLPPGGRGYERPEWSKRDQRALIERFFASPFGAPLDDADHRDLLDTLVWFGTDYGPGDPLRWSPVAVEIVLLSWLPRKIVAPADYLAKAPDLLRAFIRYCHAERGIRAELTGETLAAVDEYESEYRDIIRSPRPTGPMAILAAMGALDPDDPDIQFDPDDLAGGSLWGPGGMRRMLRKAAGSDEALRTLDDAPLPDEPFDWTGIPDDVRPRVAEVLALTDRCCDEVLDVEYRTACRRLLARAAAGEPDLFRRKGRAETAAAAVCWIVGKDNDLFTHWGKDLRVQDLLDHFGLRQSVSQRADTILRAAGFSPNRFQTELRLGAPRLLVSARRRKLIELRDEYADED